MKPKSNVKGNGQECPFHTCGRRFAPLTAEAAVSTWVGALHAKPRFLASLGMTINKEELYAALKRRSSTLSQR